MFEKENALANPKKQVMVALSLVLALQVLPSAGALAAFDSASFEAGKKVAGTSSVRLQLANRPDLGLKIDDVNDVGYALQRIRQQAINIYVEAVRKQDSPEVSADIPALTKVPAELPKDTSNLLPFRRPWLFYFLTSLEPLVHLLKEDVKDIETGAKKLDVSPATREAIEPLIKDWSQGVARLDTQLAAIMDLMEDAEKKNVELARVAAAIDQQVSQLEQIRDRCFRIVDEMEQKAKASVQKVD